MKYFLITLISCILFVMLIAGVSLALQTYQQIKPFNDFAQAYNDYVSIDPNLQDLKALKKMIHAWHKLENSQGWEKIKGCE